ncbi:hypothetical protein WG66_014171 [Moniliophthora roreri]|nr:hypothetical protein WG66_014171 [Moniliophthora roreri]
MGGHFPTEYRPKESDADILAVAYGIEFVLYVMACYLLWIHRRHQAQSYTRNIFLIVYTSVIFLLSTLYMAGLLQFTQESLIDGREIPGGPNAFETVMFFLPVEMLANVTMVITSWLCDIINSSGELIGINYSPPYYIVTLASNIIVTVLIVLRLLIYRHRITRAMGSSHGSYYTSIVAMIVESALIYSSFALAFMVPFAISSPVAQLFLQVWLSPIQGVSTILIIFRVAQGKSWSHDAYTNALASATPGVTHAIGDNTRVQFKKSGLTSAINRSK